MAERFRRGRLYLAGDAAHAYSPATGQGMNAGIQDAFNLGWKLAFAAARPGEEGLLDSYDRERRPVAVQVLAMTHMAFWAEASQGSVPSALRMRLAPLAASLAPAVIGRRHLVAEAVRLVSQLGVSYRHSPLSVEGTPRRQRGPRAGDRLPDQHVSLAGRTMRLHDLIARPGVHILLDRDADPLGTLPPSRFVSIHRLTSSPGRGLVAVRPDGYVGFRGQTAEIDQLATWLTLVRAGVAQGPASGDLSTHHPPRMGVVLLATINGVPVMLCTVPAARRVLARHGRGQAGQPAMSWAAMRLAVSAGMAKPTPMLPDCWPM